MAPIRLPGRDRADRRPTSRVHTQTVVGLGRFELPTSRLSSARSNQLSYRPAGADAVGHRQRNAKIACICDEERETKTAVSRVVVSSGFEKPGIVQVRAEMIS